MCLLLLDIKYLFMQGYLPPTHGAYNGQVGEIFIRFQAVVEKQFITPNFSQFFFLCVLSPCLC